MLRWAWHICVLHQSIFATECFICATERDLLKEREIRKLERTALRGLRNLDEEEEIENQRLEIERIETEIRETEEAARTLISIRRIREVETEFPLIVSLLRAPFVNQDIL